MTNPLQHAPAPEVELDPAAEHLARHISTATSTALAASQHAVQATTLRAQLARDAATAEARDAQRALAGQQQLLRADEASERAGQRAGIDTSRWSAYHDGDPIAALGGRGVSTPPQQVLARTQPQPATGASQPATGAATQLAATTPGQSAALGQGVSPTVAAPGVER